MPDYFWAKTTQDGSPGKSVEAHMRDVQSVANIMLDEKQSLLDRYGLKGEFISAFTGLHDIGKEIMVKRMQDYHTVMGTRNAKGELKGDAVLTYRQYLNDAFFYALLQGDSLFLNEITEGSGDGKGKKGLKNPAWGVWLGRKACIPSMPVFAGLYLTKEEALKTLLCDQPLEAFTCVQEVDSFGSGIDSLMDQPVSFKLYG
jgi:hypothetical protein